MPFPLTPPLGKFELANESIIFSPSQYPAEITVSKERNKDRKDNLCDYETVRDTGSKNRDIILTGVLFRSEMRVFDELLNESDPLDLISDEWEGEVEVVDGEYLPDGYERYRYRLSLVSTGKDESRRDRGVNASGIVNRGSLP